MHYLCSTICVAVVLFLASPKAKAETSPVAPARLTVATNVLGIATLNPTLDLEVALVGRFTVGATAWWEVRAVQDRWGQVRVSFYPGGEPLVGLGLAVTGGFHRAYREEDAGPGVKAEATSPTVGALAFYNWRPLGGRLVVAPVLGAKVTWSDNGDDSPLEPFYVEGRLNVGWAF